jgi:hypothetical protein
MLLLHKNYFNLENDNFLLQKGFLWTVAIPAKLVLVNKGLIGQDQSPPKNRRGWGRRGWRVQKTRKSFFVVLTGFSS